MDGPPPPDASRPVPQRFRSTYRKNDQTGNGSVNFARTPRTEKPTKPGTAQSVSQGLYPTHWRQNEARPRWASCCSLSEHQRLSTTYILSAITDMRQEADGRFSFRLTVHAGSTRWRGRQAVGRLSRLNPAGRPPGRQSGNGDLYARARSAQSPRRWASRRSRRSRLAPPSRAGRC